MWMKREISNDDKRVKVVQFLYTSYNQIEFEKQIIFPLLRVN